MMIIAVTTKEYTWNLLLLQKIVILTSKITVEVKKFYFTLVCHSPFLWQRQFSFSCCIFSPCIWIKIQLWQWLILGENISGNWPIVIRASSSWSMLYLYYASTFEGHGRKKDVKVKQRFSNLFEDILDRDGLSTLLDQQKTLLNLNHPH